MPETIYPNAGFARRLAALVYDFFLVVAIWMLTTTLVVVFLNAGDAVRGPVFQLLLLGEVYIFYVYFWLIKGQTLGMQVWKIRTLNDQDEVMDLRVASQRFAIATLTLIPLGLGFFWMLADPARLTLYDRLSKTRVVYLGAKPYESERL